MIKNIDDFKKHANKYLWDAWGSASGEDEKNINELIRIIELIGSNVIYEIDGKRFFMCGIELSSIIDILSKDGKIKKLSEVDFYE